MATVLIYWKYEIDKLLQFRMSYINIKIGCNLGFSKFTPLANEVSETLFVSVTIPWTRDEHGSGLDQTGSGPKPILAGSGLGRTAIFLKIDWSGLDRTEKICCFDVIILTTSSMLVVMWFYRLVKWYCIFCHQRQKLCWDDFAVHPTSSRLHIQRWVRIANKKLNVVKVLVSVPAVHVFSSSTFTLCFGFSGKDRTFDRRVF